MKRKQELLYSNKLIFLHQEGMKHGVNRHIVRRMLKPNEAKHISATLST